MVPNIAIRKLISGNTLFNMIYVTEMGNYPKAASHYTERKNGILENNIVNCLTNRIQSQDNWTNGNLELYYRERI